MGKFTKIRAQWSLPIKLDTDRSWTILDKFWIVVLASKSSLTEGTDLQELQIKFKLKRITWIVDKLRGKSGSDSRACLLAMNSVTTSIAWKGGGRLQCDRTYKNLGSLAIVNKQMKTKEGVHYFFKIEDM